MVCPAALYKRDEDGNVSFDYAGCLERGTGRIIFGGDTIVNKLARTRARPWAWSTRFGDVADGDAAEGATDLQNARSDRYPLFR